jgi:hypothetical protein
MFGLSAVRVRHLMRRWGWGSGGVQFISDVLELSHEQARELLEALAKEGYVERNGRGPVSPGWEYGLTVRGTALAQASAATPLRRQTVRRRLHELVERMVEVNSDDRFFIGVQDAAVFGSYLSNDERLGDLDVHYTTYRKIEDSEEFMRVTKTAARASGRAFSSYIDELYWPESEVRRFLKNRSRVYSLGDNSQLLRNPSVPRRSIFQSRAPVQDWRKL